MGERECVYIAAKMLGCDPYNMQGTHEQIYRRLCAIDDLCETCQGSLRSRQVIAQVIEQYKREVKESNDAH